MIRSGDLGFLFLALLLGALMSRTSLCTVAAIRDVIIERRWSGMKCILAASSAAGCVLLACFLSGSFSLELPRSQPVGLSLLIGGLLLGAGTLVNGACYLGSVLYLGRGNLNFLFTLLGLALVAHGVSSSAAAPDPTHHAASLFTPVLRPTIGLAAFAMLLTIVLKGALRAEDPKAGRSLRIPLLMAAATGACAGLINATHPGWSYGVVIDSLMQHRHGMVIELTSAILLFAGAAANSLLQHRFQFIVFRPVVAIRCLLGGVVMGYGAHQIPGGNDSLLMWAIPGLTLYGVIGYMVMATTIAAAFIFGRYQKGFVASGDQ